MQTIQLNLNLILAKRVYNLIVREARVPCVVLASCKTGYPTALRHGTFFVSRQHRAHTGRTLMLYSWEAGVFIHRLWNNVCERWIMSNFPCKLYRTANTTSGWKSSQAKFSHRNSSGERRLKNIASREEDDNKKPRSRENIAYHSEGNVVNTATTNMYRGCDKIVIYFTTLSFMLSFNKIWT